MLRSFQTGTCGGKWIGLGEICMAHPSLAWEPEFDYKVVP